MVKAGRCPRERATVRQPPQMRLSSRPMCTPIGPADQGALLAHQAPSDAVLATASAQQPTNRPVRPDGNEFEIVVHAAPRRLGGVRGRRPVERLQLAASSGGGPACAPPPESAPTKGRD